MHVFWQIVLGGAALVAAVAYLILLGEAIGWARRKWRGDDEKWGR